MPKDGCIALQAVESMSKISAGLLGAKIDHDMLVTLGGRYIVNCRLEEIERRILDAEACILALNDVVQP